MDSEAVNPEATVASADMRSSPRARLVGTLKVVGVWAVRPWYGSRTDSCRWWG